MQRFPFSKGRRLGRLISTLKINNASVPSKKFECEGLVDTGSTYVVLPSAWKRRLGKLQKLATVEVETATQEVVSGEVCGPVKIQVGGFRPVYGEVLFMDMEAMDGEYEPLIGYLVLEAIPVAVDLLGHRLVKVKYADLK